MSQRPQQPPTPSRSPAAHAPQGRPPRPAGSQPPKPQPPSGRAPQGAGGAGRWERLPRWAKRALVVAISALGLLLVSGVALRVALPSIVASYARDYLPEVEKKLGYTLRFEDIELPSLDQIRLINATLSDPKTGEPLLTLRQLDVSLRYSIWDIGGLKVAQIEAEGLRVTATRDAHDVTNYERLRPQLEKLLKPSPPPDPTKPPQPKEESPLAKYFKPMPAIIARDVAITYRDHMEDLSATLALKEARYTLQNDARHRLDAVVVSGLDLDLTHGPNGKSSLHQLKQQVEAFFAVPPLPPGVIAAAPVAAPASAKTSALEVSAEAVRLRLRDDTADVTATFQVNLDLSRPTKQSPFAFTGDLHADLQLTTHPRASLDLAVRGSAKGDDVHLDLDVKPTTLFAPLNQALGRPVRLSGIAFDAPATITLRGLEVAAPRRDDPSLLRIGKLRVQLRELTPPSLRDMLLKEIQLEDVTARVAFDDKGLPEVRAMMDSARAYAEAHSAPAPAPPPAPVDPSAPPPPPPPSPKAWFTYFQRVSLTNAHLTFQDLSAPGSPSLTIARLDLDYGFRALRKVADAELVVALNDPARPELRAQVNFDRATYELGVDVTLQDLHVAALTPILKPYLDRVPLLRRAVSLEEVVLQTAPPSDALSPGGGSAQYSATNDIPDSTPDLRLSYNIRSHNLSARGGLGVQGLSLHLPTLSHLPIDGLDLNLDVDLRYDHASGLLDVPTLVIANQAAVLADLDLSLSPAHLFDADGAPKLRVAPDARFDVRFFIPKQPTQVIFESVPYALRHTLQGMQLAGNLEVDITASGQLNQLKKTTIAPKVTLSGFDVLAWPPAADLRALNAGWPAMPVLDPNASRPHTLRIPPSTHPIEPLRASQMQRVGVSNPGGFAPKIGDVSLGNSYPHWVPFRDISPWLIQMVTTTEDGGFFTHQGFSVDQMLDALQTNLDKDEFSRGASTISMQLIKNMFLGRDKTVARKLQEVYLTWLMESFLRVPKRRILELYFNVIEFGPDLYGIREASRHYFGKQPTDLSPGEAAFLVALLPRPRDFHRAWVDGAIDARKLKLIHRYLDIMYARKCDPATLAKLASSSKPKPFERACPAPADFEDLKSEPIRFYKPRPSDPAFRPDLYFEDGSPRFSYEPASPFGVNSEDLDPSYPPF